jgi:hypothetical protein
MVIVPAEAIWHDPSAGPEQARTSVRLSLRHGVGRDDSLAGSTT